MSGQKYLQVPHTIAESVLYQYPATIHYTRLTAKSHSKNCEGLRKFRQADLNTVKRLIHNTIDVCYPADYCPEAIKYFKNYHNSANILKGVKKGYTIILKRGRRIIATGTLIKNGYITRVFVHPKFQKQGLGRLVMQKLHTKAFATGIKTVKLDASLTAKNFYDSLGYRTIKKTFVKLENGKKLPYYKMKKTLKK